MIRPKVTVTTNPTPLRCRVHVPEKLFTATQASQICVTDSVAFFFPLCPPFRCPYATRLPLSSVSHETVSRFPLVKKNIEKCPLPSCLSCTSKRGDTQPNTIWTYSRTPNSCCPAAHLFHLFVRGAKKYPVLRAVTHLFLHYSSCQRLLSHFDMLSCYEPSSPKNCRKRLIVVRAQERRGVFRPSEPHSAQPPRSTSKTNNAAFIISFVMNLPPKTAAT